MDENVDCVTLYLFVPAVDALLDFCAGENPAGSLDERVHEREFAGRKKVSYTVMGKLVCRCIELCWTGDQPGGSLAHFPSQNGSHSCEQLPYFEGFDKIIVRPEIKTQYTLVEAIAGGDDEHWRIDTLVPSGPQKIDAFSPWQSQIEQDNRVRGIVERCLPVSAIADPIDRHAFGGEGPAKAFPDHIVIFYE